MTRTDTALTEAIERLARQQIDEGRQLGLQVAVYRNGHQIVSVDAGQMGPQDIRPVQPDTLFSSFSTTKGVAATALHILADRGLIDYDAPVARYWPEFAANGKERITVAQALSHQAGLHAMPPQASVEHLLDWQGGLDFVARAAPAWEPGTATSYHAITYAWIVGGIVQGATGRHIKDVVREEIGIPLGVETEMFIGIPQGVEERLASLDFKPPDTPPPALPPEHDLLKAMPPSLPWHLYNELRVRQACLPSANGHFSARALARMYGMLANGGAIDGVRLVSPERIAVMQRLQTQGMDRVLGMPVPKGVGYFFGGDREGVRSVFGPRRSAFGHSGFGGSTAFADPEVNLAIAVTLNLLQLSLQAEGPTFEICDLIRRELGLSG